MKIKIVKKVIFGLVVLYVLMFAGRVAYEFTSRVDDSPGGYLYMSNMATPESRSFTGNYATLKMEYAGDGFEGSTIFDQKYERIASIVSRTATYDDDMDRFNAALEDYKAVVQVENRSGLPGARRAVLTIGVRPENFDTMQEAVTRIGKLVSSTTTKTDKTYEYRQILADKETLEHRKASYEELRKLGGSIPDLLQLEERIIEVESQIQQQMIGLGEYSDENALCTINYTIYEGSEPGFLLKIWNALIWTTSVYATLLAVALLTAVAAFVFVWCWSRIKRLLGNKPDVLASAQPAQPEQTAAKSAQHAQPGQTPARPAQPAQPGQTVAKSAQPEQPGHETLSGHSAADKLNNSDK
jgi:hypothetical protein